jgi:hypothetical protein
MGYSVKDKRFIVKDKRLYLKGILFYLKGMPFYLIDKRFYLKDNFLVNISCFISFFQGKTIKPRHWQGFYINWQRINDAGSGRVILSALFSSLGNVIVEFFAIE